jgi:fibronectin type 3 domain-containing protein
MQGCYRDRRRQRAILRSAVVLETLELRQLMCFVHDGVSDGVAMKTDGFAPMPAASASGEIAAAAAPGMPDLNSRPAAPAAIFIDFDGDTYTRTTAYSEDADATTFNLTEAANIIAAWDKLTSYFAMFDVNVTTTQPAAGVPTAWIAVGNNIVGGYSSVGVFPNTYPQSFNQSSHARDRVVAIAHELGHNFGLDHQADWDRAGNLVKEYSYGADLLHGAIMGQDGVQNVNKWTLAHDMYSVSALQDDLAVIAGKIKPYQPAGGDGYAPDDFANTIATTSALTLSSDGLTQQARGVIERYNDVDVFSFTITSSTIPANISALPRHGSGVDVVMSLYKSDGSLLAVKDELAANHQALNLSLAPGTYYALLSSKGNYGDLGQYDMTVQTWANGWASHDVGPVPRPGSAAFDAAAATYALSSYGTIGSLADALRYVYKPLTGNGTLIARVDSISGNAPQPRAGIMIRETLDPGSRFVIAGTDNNYGFGYRPEVGYGLTVGGDSTGTAAPVWLKLQRVGEIITGYKSADGVSWTEMGNLRTTMGSTAYIGLFLTPQSSNPYWSSSAVFSNVSVTGNSAPHAPPTYNTLPIPTNVAVAPQATGTGMRVTWNDISGETGYLVERASDGVNFTTAATLAAGVTSFNDDNLAGSFRYFYRVSALGASSPSSRSQPSAVASAINRPSAVTNFLPTVPSTSQIILNWRDTSGENGYRLERSTDGGGTWSLLANLAANVPSYTDNAVVQGQTYHYRLTPLSALGDGVAATTLAQTRLNAVTNLAFTKIETNRIEFSWTGGVPHATGYRIERSNTHYGYTTVATLPASASSYVDTTATPLTRHYYRVVAINSVAEGMWARPLMGATPPTTPLPIGWGNLDVGPVVSPGASGFDAAGTTATVIGGGRVIGVGLAGTDRHQFLFKRTTGDGEIIVCVASRETYNSPPDINTEIQAGIMFRDSLSATSNFAFMRFRGNYIGFDHRGDNSGTQNTAVSSAIRWLKLTRVGNVFTGYYSADGVAWTSVGSKTILMPSGAPYVGMAVATNSDNFFTRALFDSIGGSALNKPDVTAPARPTVTTFSNDTGASTTDRITSDNTLIINGAAEPAALVTVSRSGVGVIGTTRADSAGAWAFDYTAVPLGEGTHTFTATATDASNNVSPVSLTQNVTIDLTGPQLVAWNYNGVLNRIELQFSEPIATSSLQNGDFGTANLSDGTSQSTNAIGYLSATNTVYFQSGASVRPDGHYRATLVADGVTDVAGAASAGPFSFEFFSSTGTAAGDVYSLRLSAVGGAFEVVHNGITYSAPMAALRQIYIDSGAGEDDVSLDFSRGDWLPPLGFSLRNQETLRVTGASSSDAYNITPTAITHAAWTTSLTSVTKIAVANGAFALSSDLAGKNFEIGGAATVDVRAMQRLGTLDIAAGGRMDMNDHDLVVRATSIAAIESLLATGRLFTSDGDASGGLTTLGAATAAAVFDIAGAQTATFTGQAVSASDTIVKYTYAGDANLDGFISGDDYSSIDFNIGVAGASGWYNGDFNHDGIISGDDYSAIDFNLSAQGPPM